MNLMDRIEEYLEVNESQRVRLEPLSETKSFSVLRFYKPETGNRYDLFDNVEGDYISQDVTRDKLKNDLDELLEKYPDLDIFQ